MLPTEESHFTRRDAAEGWRLERAFHPGMPLARRQALLEGWKTAVARARHGA